MASEVTYETSIPVKDALMEPKPRPIPKKTEEKKGDSLVDWELLTDDQVAKEINRGIALLKSRQENQQKELEERHRTQMLMAMSGNSAKKRGRKAKNASGD